MRRVDQIQYIYGTNGYPNHRPDLINWKLAQTLENNRYIVQECFSSGIIRCKLPDWYLLKPNEWDLISDINLATDGFEYLRIGKYSFYIKQKRNL